MISSVKYKEYLINLLFEMFHNYKIAFSNQSVFINVKRDPRDFGFMFCMQVKLANQIIKLNSNLSHNMSCLMFL